MESKPSELITVPRSRKLARRRFPRGSDARIITIANKAPVMRRLSDAIPPPAAKVERAPLDDDRIDELKILRA